MVIVLLLALSPDIRVTAPTHINRTQEEQMMAAQSAQMEGEAMKAQGEGAQALGGG